ncbi:O-antigen ligase family protein [Pseudomonas resinovorans]|uniref:O-antigen ligase family protein n=1 Tax=Metapseudomonas resinovorans TaxID=53412 RepID=UPI00237EEDAB|nr:O-antigen ligase family protein [Pseudomonas resinovorans]MDE3740185.1 O-antigen ligase family protein [Pseudomonas resinovorans]
MSFNRSNFGSVHSFFSGILLGLPFVYPSVPYYWFAFAVFFSVLIYINKGIGSRVLVLVLMAATVSVSSSLFGLKGYEIQPLRIFFTTSYFLFFLFGWLVPDRQALLRGYLKATGVMSVAVIIAALIIRPFESGLLMFSVPELRMWGEGYFPDWPNFLAFMLATGFLLNALAFNNKVMALVNIFAALLTTSRTPLIAIAIFFVVSALMGGKSLLFRVFVFIVVVLFAFVFVAALQLMPPEFLGRLLIFSDREEVYGHALHMLEMAPFIGHGSVLFDESVGLVGHVSFHNSYLDIAVRHGLLGLLVFVALLWPRRVVKDGQSDAYLALIVFFLVGALFQNFLKHPHLIMLYSVIVCTSGVFRVKKNEG